MELTSPFRGYAMLLGLTMGEEGSEGMKIEGGDRKGRGDGRGDESVATLSAIALGPSKSLS